MTANGITFSLKRTRRPPKEMVPMEPAAFAAQLISRLENLKREQDTISSLEERLQQIQEVCVRLILTGQGNCKLLGFFPQLMTLYALFFTRRKREKIQRSWEVLPSSPPTL